MLLRYIFSVAVQLRTIKFENLVIYLGIFLSLKGSVFPVSYSSMVDCAVRQSESGLYFSPLDIV